MSRRSLGTVDPSYTSKILNSQLKTLQTQMENVLQTSVGALGEFNISNDILLTNNRSIYISGSDNYLYINGTNDVGNYEVYRLDVRDGNFFVEVSGSVG
jgi:hypothetical protein|tara:strand:- start:274 stop:570 length:297 start_codon:yes stop_codon:yes gene_type:complete